MSVTDWLLEGDPAIRWQVLQDLTGAPAGQVAAERARVEHDGWGAHLLALEDPAGLWDGGACFPASYAGGEPGQPWTPTMHTLQTLLILGLDPASASARRAIGLVAENGRWEHAGQRFFDGEVEPCINGRTIEIGAYFGVDVAGVVERILAERLADGGWNCEAENGSVRSSFDTTINVLDGLLEFERAAGGTQGAREDTTEQVRAARRGGQEYLLERGLFRRKSTGAVVDPAYLEFAFPYYWHYDVLRALDYFRCSGADPDPRMAEAVEVVRSSRQPDGRWLTGRVHTGRVYFDIEGDAGTPSRWNTLRALRVLVWWDSARSASKTTSDQAV
ncbi:MAG: squalene cyclase [Streptosporangiaceae bacterium]